MCECMADVPNDATFFYCGGPPPPPADGVLPTCQSLAIFEEDDCESYCRDYARLDYPQIEYYDDPNLVGGGISCLCSTGSGCKDDNGSPSSSSSSLRGYVARLDCFDCNYRVYARLDQDVRMRMVVQAAAAAAAASEAMWLRLDCFDATIMVTAL